MALEDKARGQRIAQMRKRRRMTQQAMAEALDVSYRAYQTWEAGTMPEWSNVEKLAKFFRVKPEAIIGEAEPGPEEAPQLDRIEQALSNGLAEKVDQVLANQDRILALLEYLAGDDARRQLAEEIVNELEDVAEARGLREAARKLADAPVPDEKAPPARRPRAARSQTPPARASR